MTRSELFKSALIAISLGGLWFFRSFRHLLFPSDFHYFDTEVPRWFDYAAILICVAIPALMIFSVRVGSKAFSSKTLSNISRILFLGLGLASFGSVSADAMTWIWPDFGPYANLPGPLGVLAVCLVLSYRDRFSLGTIASRFSSIAIILTPVALLLILQTVHVWVNGGERPIEPQEIVRQSKQGGESKVKTRVIWIIFDELGYAAMKHRPSSVKMPTMDELIASSWNAENAYPPDVDTRDSLPALLTGNPLIEAKPIANNDLRLQHPDGGTSVFSKSETTVSDITGIGGNAAIVGWCHPYSRLFAENATYAYFRSFYSRKCVGLGACTLENLEQAVLRAPFGAPLLKAVGINAPLSELDDVPEQIDRNKDLRAKALAVLANANIDLFFFHFSIPHRPFINKNDSGAQYGYFDSLEAVDRTFSAIRHSLEASGGWDKTAVIISADHWWRAKTAADFEYLDDETRAAVLNDTRVPFIVKLPGETVGAAYTPAFNTVITRYLVEAIAKGEVSTPEQLSVWLDRMAKERPDLVNFRPKRVSNLR